ncbi:unnamed protein product, partial [marine sediment metagenome]
MMEFTDKKSSMTGTVIFQRGKVEPPYCVCCGNPKVPHAHVFGEYIKLDDTPPSVFLGLTVDSVSDFIHEAIHKMKDIEEK